MYYFEWKPQPVEIEQDGKVVKIEPEFKGKITVKAPTYSQRLAYYKQAAVSVENNEAQLVNDSAVESIERIVEIAKKHIMKVELVRLEDDYKFTCVEDLEYDSEAGHILVQVGNSLVQGARLGKNLKKKSGGKSG